MNMKKNAAAQVQKQKTKECAKKINGEIMEKTIQTEELRAIFREIFKIECKEISSDVSFLGKLRQTTLNEERLSLEERNWLKNNGMLTSDSKNFCRVDNRTIFSHVISAIYAGLYGLNFVDVTSHCVETIKAKKGLKQNQNLVDFLPPQELRQFAIALYTLSNEIKQQKKAGRLKEANMSNFYYIAERAFNAGSNARQSAVQTKNSEFISRESTSKLSAENTLRNINAALQRGTFSHFNFQCSDPNDKKEIIEAKCTYIHTKNEILKMLRKHNLSDEQILLVFALVDEGYYKSKYFRNHKQTINNLLCRDNFLPTKQDMSEQISKLTITKLALQNYFKKDTSNNCFADILNEAFKSGSKAREHCMNTLSTSPEYLTSFAAALTLDKEKSQTK